MFADIASGNTGTADVMFLIGAILFGLAALFHLLPAGNPPRPFVAYGGFLIAAGLCFVAIGWLVL